MGEAPSRDAVLGRRFQRELHEEQRWHHQSETQLHPQLLKAIPAVVLVPHIGESQPGELGRGGCGETAPPAALVPNVFLCPSGKGALSGWRGHPVPWILPSCIILPPGSQGLGVMSQSQH